MQSCLIFAILVAVLSVWIEYNLPRELQQLLWRKYSRLIFQLRPRKYDIFEAFYLCLTGSDDRGGIWAHKCLHLHRLIYYTINARLQKSLELRLRRTFLRKGPIRNFFRALLSRTFIWHLRKRQLTILHKEAIRAVCCIRAYSESIAFLEIGTGRESIRATSWLAARKSVQWWGLCNKSGFGTVPRNITCMPFGAFSIWDRFPRSNGATLLVCIYWMCFFSIQNFFVHLDLEVGILQLRYPLDEKLYKYETIRQGLVNTASLLQECLISSGI